MNTINVNSTVQMAMDGQNLYISNTKTAGTKSTQKVTPITPDGSQVAQNIKDSIAQTKAESKDGKRILPTLPDGLYEFNMQFNILGEGNNAKNTNNKKRGGK